MDVLDFVTSVSADGSRIDFRLSERIGVAECAITREAVEVHFSTVTARRRESYAQIVRQRSKSDRRNRGKEDAGPAGPARATHKL
jgi:hypothetical protein